MNRLKKGALTLSASALMLIAGFEGFSDTAYQPVEGDKWTIGFGHTGGVSPGQVITSEEALSLLYKDTKAAQDAVNRYVTVPLLQREFDALVSLVYNIGPTAFRNSTLLRCVNHSDLGCISKEWMRWKYFGGKPLKGLEARRARELAVYRGEYVIQMDDRVCFGGDLCLSPRDLVQERTAGPDGAEAG